jgi:hypothetical protein
MRARASARVTARGGTTRRPRQLDRAGPSRQAVGTGGRPPGYRYVKIGSPMSIQLKIDSAFGIGTRRQPWLAGKLGTDA